MTNDKHNSRDRKPGQKPDIVIIGGSLGGLFAGVALKTHGYNTTILERTPQYLLDNQGAGIVAGGDTIEFFKRYDRTGKPVAVPSYKRIYLDQTGKTIYENEQRQNMTSWDLAYYLLRANYDRVDSGYLEGYKLPEVRPSDGSINYRYGCTVTHVEDEGEHVRVRFTEKHKNGSETEHELTTKFLVAADGPSSTVRKVFYPDIQRKYAGYVVVRGTVPETEASQAALDVFRERFCFYHTDGIQNLTYTIAGENGNTEPGKRLLNFVWYTNFPEGEPELEQVMTDKDGRRRHITIPPGMIDPAAWEMIKSQARDRLPPQMTEMAEKSKAPFVQCITDVASPKPLHMGNKVCFVGDALFGFRPHTVASTSQAAFDVMSLVDWLDGKIDRKAFVQQVMQYGRLVQSRGIYIGDRSQFQSLSVEDYIEDRNMMSEPRSDLHFPDWTREGIDSM
ncbi:Putative FAD-binding domain, FAD/NAD(P)-binding domain superfamily [Septoria linicola]|uniref:FAD-binding domain, FAD/NAD(P)-binding domain superfamily n=1 Tax=Septoria linicola TaxID=215465 RepID=A0A9Q9ELK8_9PEZI|nr:putative FAD-binding domain, FAD/NAD(P)-binding domain superfamily [Septoria linicola]USW54512.1 Putative FAD-binding domain, FAD/NAD(P)-binding domain superfamily [Septoria linicola]